AAMPPVRGRDFVMQRSWLDTGDEKMICGHSVCHQDYPPVKGSSEERLYYLRILFDQTVMMRAAKSLISVTRILK
ncbi:hypothetical protein TELCIR_21749, partial [Teladorsagia circumcincta]